MLEETHHSTLERRGQRKQPFFSLHKGSQLIHPQPFSLLHKGAQPDISILVHVHRKVIQLLARA